MTGKWKGSLDRWYKRVTRDDEKMMVATFVDQEFFDRIVPAMNFLEGIPTESIEFLNNAAISLRQLLTQIAEDVDSHMDGFTADDVFPEGLRRLLSVSRSQLLAISSKVVASEDIGHWYYDYAINDRVDYIIPAGTEGTIVEIDLTDIEKPYWVEFLVPAIWRDNTTKSDYILVPTGKVKLDD